MYSIAAKANEVTAAGSNTNNFAPKRGYKLDDNTDKGGHGMSADVADGGSTDDFTQMQVGEEGTR